MYKSKKEAIWKYHAHFISIFLILGYLQETIYSKFKMLCIPRKALCRIITVSHQMQTNTWKFNLKIYKVSISGFYGKICCLSRQSWRVFVIGGAWAALMKVVSASVFGACTSRLVWDVFPKNWLILYFYFDLISTYSSNICWICLKVFQVFTLKQTLKHNWQCYVPYNVDEKLLAWPLTFSLQKFKSTFHQTKQIVNKKLNC